MKHHLVWISSKGGKELYTVVDDASRANFMAGYMNKYYQENGQKARAYITTCDDGGVYTHKEVK